MQTRNMNARIKFFNYKSGQNEDGEIVEKQEKKEHFTCWAEVNKATMKEFKERTESVDKGHLQKRRDTRIFGIRYQQKVEPTSAMMIDFKEKTYSIIDMEIDYKNYDMLLIKAEAVV